MATQTANLESAEQQSILVGALSPAKPRLLYLDNLRTVLITCIVAGHLSVTYGFNADWIYYEGGDMNPFFNIIQIIIVAIGISFAMPLFFMIAGNFTPPAYDRRGTKRFLVDRLKRLGIPWLIYEVLINPFIHYAVDVHGGDCRGALYDCQYQGTFWQYLKEFPLKSGSIGDGPVWFLEALLAFSIFYALWRVIVDRGTWTTNREQKSTIAVPSNWVIALFILLIGLSTFIIRIWAKAYVYYEPFHLEFGRFPQYIALFIAGICAYRGNWLMEFPDRQAKTWPYVAIGSVLALPVLMIAFGALSGNMDERGFGGVNWLSLSYSLWEGFVCISMVITILTWFRRRFNHQGSLAQIMSKTSFAVYIIHPAIIVPLALALSDIQMNLSLKFLLVAPIAIVLCYLIAYGLLKIPIVRTILG
jgi:glucan biosynthesis protein C